jgi:hypothetical protein
MTDQTTPNHHPDGNCSQCLFHKMQGSPFPGKKIPGQYGKCVRPEGICRPVMRKVALGMAPAPGAVRHDKDLDKPLSERERRRLAELEGVVFANFRAAYDFWAALREIRDTKLYRETAPTFDKYVKQVFGVTKTHANRYIAAADVVDNLKKVHTDFDTNWCQNKEDEAVHHGEQNDGPESSPPSIIINEAQARELARVPAERQPEVYQATVQAALAEGKMPTAAMIRRTIRNMNLAVTQAAVRKGGEKITRTAKHVSAEFKEAFQHFLDVISAERAAHWKYTDRETVLETLKDIVYAIETEV